MSAKKGEAPGGAASPDQVKKQRLAAASRRRASLKAVPGDIAEMLVIADATMWPILSDFSDGGVWMQEAGNVSAAALQWPLEPRSRGYERALRDLEVEAVRSVLQTLSNMEGCESEVLLPGAEVAATPEFQVILRVCARAVAAADKALNSRFGGTGELGGKLKALNELKRQRVLRLAQEAGTNVTEAARAAGISPSAAYRHIAGNPKRGMKDEDPIAAARAVSKALDAANKRTRG
jgi:hypothetical protein